MDIFPMLILVAVFISLVYFAIRRVKIKAKEDFEKRDN